MEELEKNETSTQAEENTVSLASAQALADALTKIEAYTPTTWVDNSSPDIDAEHLNKPEQAIKRVTDALNSAVDVIKDLQSQATKNAGAISDVNNNLSQKFAAKDISNGSLNQITTTGFYFGSNITEVTPYIKSHKWCLINAYVSGNSASIFVIAGDAMALSIYRNGDGAYSYYPIATKSDLFGELCTNPNTLTAFVAMVNGYDSNVTNIPDAAKKKFSIILNVWASPLSYLGDLTKTHMQVLIIGNGGGVVTRKYESSAWSNWQ